MRTIREIREDELDEFVRISAEAYPGIKLNSKEERQRFRERLQERMKYPDMTLWGLFEAEQMLGIMRFYDFTMKLRSTRTLIGGVGGVAVDLRHKKEKVAADMLRFFHNHYRQKGACLTALYPFRPDFYKQMGYGYGTKMNHYTINPASLPRPQEKLAVDYLGPADREEYVACYTRYLERTNGLFEMPTAVVDAAFTDPALIVAGYRQDGELGGYLAFRFEEGPHKHFLNNDLVVYALVYETREALQALLGFLRIQADQVERVLLNTQDDLLHFLLADPRNGSGTIRGLSHESNIQGVGLMYRIIDVSRYFEALAGHDFGGQNGRLRITLTDTFLPENGGSTVVAFEDGRASVQSGGGADVEIKMNVAEFSSLVVGAINFSQLYNYNLADISDTSCLHFVDQLFYSPQKPICMTAF